MGKKGFERTHVENLGLSSLEQKKIQIELLNSKLLLEYNSIHQFCATLISVTLLAQLMIFLFESQKNLLSHIAKKTAETIQPFLPLLSDNYHLSDVTYHYSDKTSSSIKTDHFSGAVIKRELAQSMSWIKKEAPKLCALLSSNNCSNTTQESIHQVDSAMGFYTAATGMSPPSEYVSSATSASTIQSHTPITSYYQDFIDRLNKEPGKYRSHSWLARFYVKNDAVIRLSKQNENENRDWIINPYNKSNGNFIIFTLINFHETILRLFYLSHGFLPKHASLSAIYDDALAGYESTKLITLIFFLILAVLQIPLTILTQKKIIQPLLNYLNPARFILKTPQLFNTSIINTEADADEALSILKQEQERIQKISSPLQFIAGFACLLLITYQCKTYYYDGIITTSHITYAIMLGNLGLRHFIKSSLSVYNNWKYKSQQNYNKHLIQQQLTLLNQSLDEHLAWSEISNGDNSPENSYFQLTVKPCLGLGIEKMSEVISDVLIEFGFNLLSAREGMIAVAYDPQLTLSLANSIKDHFLASIERLQSCRETKKQLDREMNGMPFFILNTTYSGDRPHLQVVNCQLRCTQQSFELEKILKQFEISFTVSADNVFEFDVFNPLSNEFFTHLKQKFQTTADATAISNTHNNLIRSLKSHHYRHGNTSCTRSINTKDEARSPSPSPLVTPTGDIDFGKFGYFKKQDPNNTIRPLSGKPGNFILFRAPTVNLTEKHFNNDKEAFQQFERLCEDPRYVPHSGAIGFKFHVIAGVRNFLWRPEEKDSKQHVETSIKAKLLGSHGKGAKRLFFRKEKDVTNRYTIHIPCYFTATHG